MLRKILFGLVMLVFVVPIYSSTTGCSSSGAAIDPDFNISDDGDFDGDGLTNAEDDDDDNDGVLDIDDAFPFDPDESADLDGDGVGDNSDDDADGDGALNGDDCDDLDATINPSADDTPDADSTDSNCDGVDGDSSKAIWVSGNEGNDTNDGTIANPVKTIAVGLTLATAQSKDLYIVTGTYNEDVALTDNISIYGGYDELSGGTRQRDIETNTTTIAGDGTGTHSFTLPFNGITNFEYTLLINSSTSTVGGLTILGDPTGINVFIHNSDATIQNSTTEGNDPIAPMDTALEIGIIIDDGVTTDRTVNVVNTTIKMNGTGDTSGMNYGIITIPGAGAENAINLHVENSTIISRGQSGAVVPLFAGDNDDDPTDDPTSDSAATINLYVKNNKFDLQPDAEAIIVMGAGGVGPFAAGPPGEHFEYIGQAEIEHNEVIIKPTILTEMIIG